MNDTRRAPPPALSPAALLGRVGLKATEQRLRILQLIQSSPHRHLSAEDVYQQLCQTSLSASLATVYRVLAQLEAAGLLCRQVFDDTRAVYECNDRDHHDHLVCVRCGRVEEFSEQALETIQETIAHQHGFALRTHRLTLYGLCKTCHPPNEATGT